MHNAMVVEICDGGQNGADQISGVGFIVTALTTDAIKEFSSQREVRNKIYYRKERSVSPERSPGTRQSSEAGESRTIIHSLKVIHQRQDVLMPHGHFL
jgi:hypothetical protein